MKLYGLLGYPLGHSFSAKYFAENLLTKVLMPNIKILNLPMLRML